MSVSPAKHFEVVEGEIISESVVKNLGLLLLAILFIPGGAWMTWAWWTEASLLGHQFTFVAGLFGLFLLGCGLLGVPAYIVQLWLGERLILGKDCLQSATKNGGVLTQVSYRNIDRIGFVSEPGEEKYIGINLKNPNDSDTFNAGDDVSKNSSGWHYKIIQGAWSMPVQQIYERLQKRLPM